MKRFQKIFDVIRNKPGSLIVVVLSRFGISPWISDKLYLRLIYRAYMGYWMNFERPKTFQEKLQWLKINNRNPLYSQMVDKFAAKEYVARLIGEEHIIPTLAVYNNVEEIDFDLLPDQFVLKTTHDSQSAIICVDKSTFDKEKALKRLKKKLKTQYYWLSREYPYKNVPPRIIAERYMGELGATDMIDYKFFCFNGEVKYCQVIKDRSIAETIDFFDSNWQHQEFYGLTLTSGIKQSLNHISKPENYDEMLKIAALLSDNIPFLRVDLYNVHGKIYFGEMTFFPNGGYGTFIPKQWNDIMGDMIDLKLDC